MAYIFLDESGDLGFGSKKANSRFFTITAVFVNSKKPLERVVKNIHKTLKKKVKKLSGGVLHSVKEKPATRKRLLRKTAGIDCSIMCIVLDKSRVYTKLRNEKHVLYNYVANILLDRIFTRKLISAEKEIVLIASKRETNKFLNSNFESYIKHQAKSRHKLNLRIEIKTPGEEKPLQAVDFISWAVFHKYEFSDVEYYKIIERLVVEENSLFK